MKKMKQIFKLALILVLGSTIISCGGGSKNSPQDNELKSFMLGGIYFIKGYGGMNTVANMLTSAGMTSESELISGYKELLEFPFQPEQASDMKMMLSQAWDVNNKEELIETLEELKNKQDSYKAWDYARLVNNACAGYAGGYLTKEEAKKYITELLPLAQEKYENWESYFKDFEAGRKEWNPNDPDNTAFEKASKEILTNPKSIYTILPLK